MSDHDHQHHDHGPEGAHGHSHPPAPAAFSPEDTGSQAVSEALGSSFVIIRGAMILLVILFFGSGIFTVEPQKNAVILRFGVPQGEGTKALLGPGLHWAFPKPIDEVVEIPISQIQVVNSTVGWYATTPEMEAAKNEPPPGPSLNPAFEGYALTADANIIHLRANLRYRITDPIRFMFDFTDAPAAITNALNNALLYAAAHYTVDNALTKDVAGFRDKVYNRLLQLVDQQKLGITIEAPTVQAIPPRQVQEAFNQVLRSSVAADENLNRAYSYTNEVLSQAQGKAANLVNNAQVEKTRTVEFVAAEAKKFQAVLPQYLANPELFVNLRRTEAMQRLMTNVQEKFYIPARADGEKRELRLLLGREPQKPGVR